MWFQYSELRLLPTLHVCMQTRYPYLLNNSKTFAFLFEQSNFYVYMQVCVKVLKFTSPDFMGGMAFSSPRFHKRLSLTSAMSLASALLLA